jgi:formiminotetrahydrofolate cyclodeaminase
VAQTIGEWLDALASDAPAPGGGAAAAMNAAIGAALVSMVCNLTIGKPKYAAYIETMTRALAEATELRHRALQLADDDAAAFDAVIEAYKLPKESDEEKRARSAAIQAALVGAVEVPLRTVEVAASVIALAEAIEAGANVNVLSDVAVAAASARAALDAAALNVEVNLASMSDAALRETLAGRLAAQRAAGARADEVVRVVRGRING